MSIFRAAGFFGFWLVLTDADAGDLAAGLVAAVAATWASLRLMPAQPWNLRPIKLADSAALSASIDHRRDRRRMAGARSSIAVAAGIGGLSSTTSARHNARGILCNHELDAGTLPCGAAEDNGLTIHCLDVTQPVAEQVAAEEVLCIQILGGAPRDG